MQPKITLIKKIDFVFEAYQLLCCIAEDKADVYAKIKEELAGRYGVDNPYVKESIDFVEGIMLHAREVLKEEIPRIKKLYGELSCDCTPADLVLCMEQMDVAIEGEAGLKKNYDAMTEQKRDVYFFKELVKDMEKAEFKQQMGSQESHIEVTDAVRIKHILSYIRSMDIKADEKQYLQDLYLDRDSYFEEMNELLGKAIALLKPYEKAMNGLLTTWSDYWSKVISEGTFFSSFEGFLDKIVVEEEELMVVPSFIQVSAVYIAMCSDLLEREEKRPAAWRIGVSMIGDYSLNSPVKEEYLQEEYQKIIKVLGDKSTFDILLYIKDEPSYGAEIAKRFELTTATVSHHMNKLLLMKLIQIEQRDGKMYCQTKKEMLQKAFDACKKLFE